MAASNCWRCLLRPPTSLPIRYRPALATQIAAFSTSSTSLAAPKKHAPPVAKRAGANTLPSGHIRSGKHKLGKGKKKFARAKTKNPLPGERKAFRKRIQLSNNNALAVPGLEEMSARNSGDPGNVAKMLALSDGLVDQLRAMEAFKSTQSWGFFRQPSVLVRSETVELMKKMDNAAGNKETLRLVIDGDKISGKSMLLLQAMANGFLNDWLVFNIPEAQELTTACTEYSPIPNSQPVQYNQPVYVLKLLSNLRKANEPILSKFKTAKSHNELPFPMPEGTALLNLVSSAKEPEHAWPVYQALWAELTDPTATRPPVLFALDGLSHIMKVSDYRSQAFELIHAHDLAPVRHFTDALSGATKLPHGGAIIAATSRGNAPRRASVDLSLAQRLAEQEGRDVPPENPYLRGYDGRVAAALKSVEVMKVNGISKTEARALMEYWAASGVLRTKVDTLTVADRWATGGHGIVGEMERAALLTMRL